MLILMQHAELARSVCGTRARMHVERLARPCASRRQLLQDALLCIAGVGQLVAAPALALPAECFNGVMEERQRLGLDPFAPPCTDPAGSGLPTYAIFKAKRTVDALLADRVQFRNLIRVGQSDDALQVPPVLQLRLFETCSEAMPAQALELMTAGKAYIREACACARPERVVYW